MSNASNQRKSVDSEVRRLDAAGMSQRLIAARLGISRPMVQRVLREPDPLPVSSGEVEKFRADMREAIALADGNLSQLRELVKVEEHFSDQCGLTGVKRVQLATLHVVMIEGAKANGG